MQIAGAQPHGAAGAVGSPRGPADVVRVGRDADLAGEVDAVVVVEELRRASVVGCCWEGEEEGGEEEGEGGEEFHGGRR